MRDDVIEYLATLGYEVGENDKVLIEYTEKTVLQYILNFCNLSELPDELYYTALEMIVGNFLNTKWTTGSLDLGDLDLSAPVSSIKEGDTQVSYSTGTTDNATMLKTFIQRVTNCDEQLVAFRRLRW